MGLVAQLVDSRTREFGVRLALGAVPWQVVMLVVRDAVALVGAGVALGTAGAFALTRIISSLLTGVSPTDPFVFVTMVALLAVVAALAAALPAARAARLQPALVLRRE